MSDKNRSTPEMARMLRESIDASIRGDHERAAELLDPLDRMAPPSDSGRMDSNEQRMWLDQGAGTLTGKAHGAYDEALAESESQADSQERYFRFDIEPADAYLGDPGDPCDFENCDAGGAYHVSVELQGNRAEQLACVEHVEHMANALLFDVNSSVRVDLSAGEHEAAGELDVDPNTDGEPNP